MSSGEASRAEPAPHSMWSPQLTLAMFTPLAAARHVLSRLVPPGRLTPSPHPPSRLRGSKLARGRPGRDRALDEAEDEAAHVATLVGATGVGPGREQAADRLSVTAQDMEFGIDVDAAEGERDSRSDGQRAERRLDEPELRACVAGSAGPRLGLRRRLR